MQLRRETPVRAQLETLLEALCKSPAKTRALPDQRISGPDAMACVEAAFKSRLLDLKARELKDSGEGFYTIGSAGHEGNAVFGQLLRTTDPCFLHYRSAALMAARSQKSPGESFLHDCLLAIVASAEDPVSAGRHKVFGSRSLWVPPQTSTIASHLPKALGMAFAIDRKLHLGLASELPPDSIIFVSFGDASCNHASATTTFNAACWASAQHIPLPLLFVCEDNGMGISVHSPKGYIASVFRERQGIDYFDCNGLDLAEAYATARGAIAHCRETRRPTFLHFKVIRLLGHAGSDVESLYLDERTIQQNEARDPLLAMSRFVVERGHVTGDELLALYRGLDERVSRVAQSAKQRPKLVSVDEIVKPLDFPQPAELSEELAKSASMEKRARVFGGKDKLPENARKRHMAWLLSQALADLMVLYPQMIVFGEDVARKGGVYHVTAGLFARFGVGRVFNTLLDETTILGLAIGAAQAGFLPVPEIQYLAYLHNAEDQLRGEAATLRFFSNGEFDNPMLIRIAAFAYQKGFGGHFHNDNSIAVLRDIPGLIIAAPSRGDDAVLMLRTCMAAASAARRVCVFLEPIALYMRKDLHEDGDGAWCFAYPSPGEAAAIGEARHYPASQRVAETQGGILLVSYGNGIPMSLRARARLAKPLQGFVHVMDLRWLAPLPITDFLEHARRADAVLIVDECRKTGSVSEALAAAIAEDDAARPRRVKRLTAVDSFIPLGDAANLLLPSEEGILAALSDMIANCEVAR